MKAFPGASVVKGISERDTRVVIVTAQHNFRPSDLSHLPISAQLTTQTTGFGCWKPAHVFNTNPSFHVPAFICRSAKPGDKQNGTTRLQGTRCKRLIKGRRQEKKSSECLQEDWGTARAVRGGDIQTLYTLRRQEGGYVGNAVNHISSPYHRREDGQCGSSLASCLLVRFTAVVPQIVSFF